MQKLRFLQLNAVVLIKHIYGRLNWEYAAVQIPQQFLLMEQNVYNVTHPSMPCQSLTQLHAYASLQY